MARYGSRIRNPATGSIQIDDTYSNLALISKGSVAVNTTATVVFSGTDFPVIALRSTVPVVILGVARNDSANTWTFTLRSKSSVTVQYFLFAEPPELGPGWGKRIKKAGKVIYDSRHRYLRQVTTLRGTAPNNAGAYAGDVGPGTSLPAGKTYAVIMGGRTGRTERIVAIYSNNNYMVGDGSLAYGVSVNGGTIASEMLSIYSYSSNFSIPPSPPPPEPYQFRQPQYSWAIIDVTDY